MPGRPKKRARDLTAIELAAWELDISLRKSVPNRFQAAAEAGHEWEVDFTEESTWASTCGHLREARQHIEMVAGLARQRAALLGEPLAQMSADDRRRVLDSLHLRMSDAVANVSKGTRPQSVAPNPHSVMI